MNRLAIVSYFFPPAGTVQRPLKLASHLAALGVETHVVAPHDSKWVHADETAVVPDSVVVHRARYLGPRARRLGDELYGSRGFSRAIAHARHFVPRLLIPDEALLWALTATPVATRVVRQREIDVVLTSSSPSSVHLIGAAVKRVTGAAWVADLRDSLQANPHRRSERALARAKQQGERNVARLVARYADAVVAASAAIAEEIESLQPSGPVALIPNGCDYDDFEGFVYSRGDRFRLTHTGSFYAYRDPRPLLTAVARSRLDLVVRFVGDFRSRDRAWAERQGLGDRIELYDHVPRRRALELQRDSEALLLLVPEAGGRGRGVLTAKLFEYLAAERPILAVVPEDGEAAALVRETAAGVVVAPEDGDGIRRELQTMFERFKADCLEPVQLPPETRKRLSRAARVAELKALLDSVA